MPVWCTRNISNTDEANATQELLHQLGASGTDYVLSCVAEARRMGKTRQAIQGLQYIVENFSEGGGYKGIHTPGIFQYVSVFTRYHWMSPSFFLTMKLLQIRFPPPLDGVGKSYVR